MDATKTTYESLTSQLMISASSASAVTYRPNHSMFERGTYTHKYSLVGEIIFLVKKKNVNPLVDRWTYVSIVFNWHQNSHFDWVNGFVYPYFGIMRISVDTVTHMQMYDGIFFSIIGIKCRSEHFSYVFVCVFVSMSRQKVIRIQFAVLSFINFKFDSYFIDSIVIFSTINCCCRFFSHFRLDQPLFDFHLLYFWRMWWDGHVDFLLRTDIRKIIIFFHRTEGIKIKDQMTLSSDQLRSLFLLGESLYMNIWKFYRTRFHARIKQKP